MIFQEKQRKESLILWLSLRTLKTPKLVRLLLKFDLKYLDIDKKTDLGETAESCQYFYFELLANTI